MAIINRLKELLYEKGNGLKDKEIAGAIGLTPAALSRIKRDRHYNISLDDIDKLCKYFNVPLGELLVISNNGNRGSNTYIPPPVMSNYNPLPTLSVETRKEAQVLLRNLDQKAEAMELLIKQTVDDFTSLPAEAADRAEEGLGRLDILRSNLNEVKRATDKVRQQLEQANNAQS